MTTVVRQAAPGTARAALARIARGIACIGVAAVVASSANAEIFKCRSADGRILYSDSPCPASSHGEVLVPNDNSPIPAAKPAPAPPAPPSPPSPSPSTDAGAPPRSRPAPEGPQTVAATTSGYELSANERQRVVNLEQVQRSGDNAEKREAARMEIQEIRRGTLARMSFEDQRRKDGLWVDLGNLDPQRRIAAVRQLGDLFATYR